jgi:hypothetical protein
MIEPYAYIYVHIYIGQVVIEPMHQISTEEQTSITDSVDKVLIDEQALLVARIANKSFTFNKELNCYEEDSKVCILYLNIFIYICMYIYRYLYAHMPTHIHMI